MSYGWTTSMRSDVSRVAARVWECIDSGATIMTGDDVSPDCPWTHGRSRYLLETSLPGIFAAGDVRSRSVKRVAAGVCEGSIAIASVHQFLQAEMAGQPYQDRGTRRAESRDSLRASAPEVLETL